MRNAQNFTKYTVERKERGERMDEKQIISAICKRDQEGLNYLMKEMKRNVYALCFKIMGQIGVKEDIEELVSDVFISVWEKCEEYEPDKGSLKTWVYIIAKYKALDWKRKAEKNVNTSMLNEEMISDNHLDHQKIETEIDVKSFVQTLNVNDRHLLIRRCFFDEDLESIAEDLQTNRKALDTRLWRIRKNLKEFFLKEGGKKVE